MAETVIPADPVAAYLEAHFRPDVAADLLAVAQPLMAFAWEEGRVMGIDECAGDISGPVNPYKEDA